MGSGGNSEPHQEGKAQATIMRDTYFMRDYFTAELNSRPDILDVVGRYTSLRKVGREYIGSSPCHNDRHPSLRVNSDKQLWYCDPCASGGDVIRFVEAAEKVPFKEALSILGIGGTKPSRPVEQRRAAAVAASWMAEQRRKVNVLLGDVLEKIELADEAGDNELAESFIREQSFLRDLYEDLDIPRNAAALLSIRATIEAITEGIEL